MKNRTILPLFILILFSILISCTKKESIEGGDTIYIIEHNCDTNSAPLCSITYPNNGDIFYPNNIISIEVNAEDTDGAISEVRFFINGIGINSMSQPPFIYNWDTQDLEFGEYTLQAIAQDNKGNITSDEISIEIIDFQITPGGNMISFGNDTNILLFGFLSYDYVTTGDVHLSTIGIYKDYYEVGAYSFGIGILLHDESGIDGIYTISETFGIGYASEVVVNKNVSPGSDLQYYITEGQIEINEDNGIYTILFDGEDSEGTSVHVFYNGLLDN